MAAIGPPRARTASPWWLLVVLPVLLLGQWHALWGADEPREAEIAREMFASGDWVVPRFNGMPFLEKPPLAHWGVAALFTALGMPSEEWCRLPAPLWGILTILACTWLGSMIFDRRVGVLAGVVLATSQEFVINTHELAVDTPMAAGVAFALASFWAGHTASLPRRRRLFYALTAVAAGVAFLGKGPIGVALPMIGVGAFLVWRKEWGEVSRVLAPQNLALFAAVSGPWLVMVRSRGGGAAFRALFWDNMVVRFLSGSADHAAPPWEYAFSIFQVTVPWVIFIPPVVAALARPGPFEGPEGRRGWQFLISIMLAPLLLLSLASAKRPSYLLPLMPAFAVAVAAWLEGALQRSEARWLRVWRTAGTAVFALTGVAAWVVSGFLAVRGHGGLAVSLLGLAAALTGAAALGVTLWKEGPRRTPAFAGALAVLVLLSLLSPSTFAAIDEHRGNHALSDAVAGAVPAGVRLYGYDMGERELGVVCFLRQATVPQLSGPEALRRVVRDGEGVVVVSVAAMKALQAEGAWPAEARLVSAPAMHKRPYVLVRGGSLVSTPQR